MKTKKLITALFFAVISCVAVAQNVKVENGKAVLVTPAVPEQKTVISKEDLFAKKIFLLQDISVLNSEVSRKQKQLTDLKAKLAQVDSVCKKLGYK